MSHIYQKSGTKLLFFFEMSKYFREKIYFFCVFMHDYLSFLHFLPQKIDLPRFPLDQRPRGGLRVFGENIVPVSVLVGPISTLEKAKDNAQR